MRAEADQPDATFGMTDLEEALARPDGAALRSAIADRLDAMAHRAEAALQGGVAPHGFAATCAIRDALTTARDLIRPGA
jgi:hypothetical protein